MVNNSKNQGSIVAIITMMFLYAMISFVTNLAAPIGVIWKNQPELAGSNTLGMMGNMMNFAAYLFMGIPAGKLLTKIGYKKTALVAIAIGFIGVFVQYLSGVLPETTLMSLPSNFYVYLLGAFIGGFCVCILNTVVNPMLNLLGGGGNRGNQLNLIGGTLNSLTGTLTPMLVGAMIGDAAKARMDNVLPLLYIAMGIFAAVFIILMFIPIANPQNSQTGKSLVFEHSPWAFRHFVLGVIAIFVYVGVEVGIPGTLNFYLSDSSANGGGLDPSDAAAIAGSVAATYWFLMLVGRFVAGFIADKVSSKLMVTVTSGVAIILLLGAMFLGKSIQTSMPAFTGSTFVMYQVPISALLLVLCGLCTSVMWSSIFNLAVEGLGKYTEAASGIFMMMVVGGGILPLIQNFAADNIGYMISYIVPLIAVAYILFYAVVGSKNVNKDIPV